MYCARYSPSMPSTGGAGALYTRASLMRRLGELGRAEEEAAAKEALAWCGSDWDRRGRLGSRERPAGSGRAAEKALTPGTGCRLAPAGWWEEPEAAAEEAPDL